MPKFSEISSLGHPNLVAPICVSPGTNISMHGIRPCSTPMQTSSQHKLYQFGPSAMRPSATILFARFLRFRWSQSFRLFNFFGMPTTTTYSSPSAYPFLIGQRSSLAMPYPKHRSHYSQVFYVVAAA